MTPFVSDKDLISVSVFYSAGKNKFGFNTVKVVDEKKAKELMQSPDTAATIKTLNTKWRQPTWESQQKLYADFVTDVNAAIGQFSLFVFITQCLVL